MTKWCVKSLALSETPFTFATSSERSALEWLRCALARAWRGAPAEPLSLSGAQRLKEQSRFQ